MTDRGSFGLLGQVGGAFPADEAVQGQQRGQHEAVPQRACADVRWVDVRIAKPASWWKKKMAPKNSRAAATTEPAISKNTPVLLTALTARMLMMLISPATTMASVANSTMSPWVGDFQMSLANTVARATAVAAVPAMKASSAV